MAVGFYSYYQWQIVKNLDSISMVLVVIKNNQKKLNTSDSLDGKLQLGGAFEAVGRATYIKHVCKQQYDVFDIETVASFFFS